MEKWNSVVEQFWWNSRTVMWNTEVEQWNSVGETVWCNSGTVWWNSGTVKMEQWTSDG